MSSIEAHVKTPCNRVCALHPISGLCVGCGRSIEEIAGWIGFDERKRTAIMALLPARLSAMTAGNIAPVMA
jgi:predicted Fe-S protein YdhL (DUF1289 family)